MDHYGLDTSSYSFPYVATWGEDRNRVTTNLSSVQRGSNILISAIEGTNPNEVASTDSI